MVAACGCVRVSSWANKEKAERVWASRDRPPSLSRSWLPAAASAARLGLVAARWVGFGGLSETLQRHALGFCVSLPFLATKERQKKSPSNSPSRVPQPPSKSQNMHAASELKRAAVSWKARRGVYEPICVSVTLFSWIPDGRHAVRNWRACKVFLPYLYLACVKRPSLSRRGAGSSPICIHSRPDSRSWPQACFCRFHSPFLPGPRRGRPPGLGMRGSAESQFQPLTGEVPRNIPRAPDPEGAVSCLLSLFCLPMHFHFLLSLSLSRLLAASYGVGLFPSVSLLYSALMTLSANQASRATRLGFSTGLPF